MSQPAKALPVRLPRGCLFDCRVFGRLSPSALCRTIIQPSAHCLRQPRSQAQSQCNERRRKQRILPPILPRQYGEPRDQHSYDNNKHAACHSQQCSQYAVEKAKTNSPDHPCQEPPYQRPQDEYADENQGECRDIASRRGPAEFWKHIADGRRIVDCEHHGRDPGDKRHYDAHESAPEREHRRQSDYSDRYHVERRHFGGNVILRPPRYRRSPMPSALRAPRRLLRATHTDRRARVASPPAASRNPRYSLDSRPP